MKPWKDFCIENNLFTKSAVSVRARYREEKKNRERNTERSHEEGAMNVYRGSPRRFIDVAVAISSASIWTLTRVERRTRNRETPSTRWRDDEDDDEDDDGDDDDGRRVVSGQGTHFEWNGYV